GSIKDKAALNAVCTSSSRNSAIEVSMAGRAPVDSPTSIIWYASSGNIAVSSRLLERARPSRTFCTDERTAFDNSLLSIEEPAVSSACTRGSPPLNKVDSVREKIATWYFSQIPPARGSERRKRSIVIDPASVLLHRTSR